MRAALLWSLNPLLLYELVVGAHLDTIAVALGMAGLAVLRRTTGAALAAGALVGAAVAVKLPLALFGGALVWVLRREPRRVLALAAGAMLVLVPSYLAAGPHVFDQLRRAATYVSLATPWRMVLDPLTGAAGEDDGRRIITGLAALVAILLAALLFRALPRVDADRPDLDAARVACVLTVAWVLAAPYALPWYDALVWAPLALLPASRLDLLLLARTFVLALAYVPGRTVTLLHRGPALGDAGLPVRRRAVAGARPDGQRAGPCGDRRLAVSSGSCASSSSSALTLAARSSGIATKRATAGIAMPESLTAKPMPRVASTAMTPERSVGDRS